MFLTHKDIESLGGRIKYGEHGHILFSWPKAKKEAEPKAEKIEKPKAEKPVEKEAKPAAAKAEKPVKKAAKPKAKKEAVLEIPAADSVEEAKENE